MNFEEFKAIMCDLATLEYVRVKAFEDHCFVLITKQENDETRDLISEKIINIWENSNIVGGYRRKDNREFIFVKVDDFIKCFEEENYEKIIEKIQEFDPSFIHGYVIDHGIQKKIKLFCDNEYGFNRNFENSIYKIIEEELPEDVSLYNDTITTKKARKWEEKKMNCAEIKICEDFDKILSRY